MYGLAWVVYVGQYRAFQISVDSTGYIMFVVLNWIRYTIQYYIKEFYNIHVRYLLSRYLLRFFDYLAHPNLSGTFATDQKWPICHLRISYQSLAGKLCSLKKSRVFKVDYFILPSFLVPKSRSMAQMSGKNTHIHIFYFWFKNKRVWAEKIGKIWKNSKKPKSCMQLP